MDLSAARDVAEERVCALLGIPAAVVGFGAGLQTAKVGATMGELRTLAWTNGVLPSARSLAGELDRSFAEMMEDADKASRSEERRVGKEGDSTGRSRCAQYHKKKKKKKRQ